MEFLLVRILTDLMKIKKKQCDVCKKEKMIWKNHEGKKFCQQCWNGVKPVKAKPTAVKRVLPSRSLKRSKEEKLYSGKRIIFLNEHPMCEAHLSGCYQYSSQVHHKYSGKDRSSHFLDKDTWMAVCHVCHQWIHLNSKEARKLGYLK